MSGMSALRRRLPWALLAAGLALIAQGSYLPIKAALAQTLIASSWHLRSAGEPARNPWPWADTRPVARLWAPRLGISQFVMQDDSGESLAFGPGLVPTEVGAEAGNTVIAGHRDTHFDFLGDLRPGDRLGMEDDAGRTTLWQVQQSNVFDSRDGLMLHADEQTLRLVTCWPLDAVIPGGPQRFQIIATPVSVTAADAGDGI